MSPAWLSLTDPVLEGDVGLDIDSIGETYTGQVGHTPYVARLSEQLTTFFGNARRTSVFKKHCLCAFAYRQLLSKAVESVFM
jgi:hypothetical protein